VLLVPVPELEEFVRARTVHYDADYLSADPAFTHAHVTVLGPFVPRLDDTVAERIGRIAAQTPAFDFVLDRTGTFPNGIIHLRPEPDGPFRSLTERFVAEFPGFAPYGGAFPDVVPHLTLDAVSDTVGEASTRAMLGSALPTRCRAERLDLAWYDAGNCHVVRSWRLGLPGVGDGR
jgi:2'-5' RNA ligase